MKLIKQSIIFFLALTIIVGGVYPAIVYGVSQVFFTEKARGGIVVFKDQKVGAHLIAQEFVSEKHFWGRPSAASYNAQASSGSNYALTNADYKKALDERKARGLDFDLLTTSGSGLDPDITPAAAYLQVERVAKASGISPVLVTNLVKENITKRQLGFLGEERVNVLKLNISLESMLRE
jgi:K+-transporting ATPase ATPase C chain